MGLLHRLPLERSPFPEPHWLRKRLVATALVLSLATAGLAGYVVTRHPEPAAAATNSCPSVLPPGGAECRTTAGTSGAYGFAAYVCAVGHFSPLDGWHYRNQMYRSYRTCMDAAILQYTNMTITPHIPSLDARRYYVDDLYKREVYLASYYGYTLYFYNIYIQMFHYYGALAHGVMPIVCQTIADGISDGLGAVIAANACELAWNQATAEGW